MLEIHRVARRHGVDPADIEHVVAHPLAVLDEENDEGINQALYLGWDRAGGTLLEVVVLHVDDGREMAIHAMKMATRVPPVPAGRARWLGAMGRPAGPR